MQQSKKRTKILSILYNYLLSNKLKSQGKLITMKRILFILIITILSILNSETFAKNYIVHCQVFNEAGKPVIGASVRLANTMLGATVNREGQAFIKNVPIGQYHIILSAVGYETYEEDITVSEEKTHNSHIDIYINMKI